MTLSRSARHIRRFGRFVVVGVLFGLGLAQTLGLLHRIVHLPTAAAAVAPALQAGDAAVDAAATTVPVEARSWLQALFAGHGSERGCDLFDHSSHFDLLTAGAAGLPSMPPAGGSAGLHAGWHLATQAAGFLARGPPPRG